MTTTTNCEVKIEWRDGASLHGRYTDLEEIRGWPRDDGPGFHHLTFSVPEGKVSWGKDENWTPTFWFGNSWVECRTLGECLGYVDRLLDGETFAALYDSI